MVTVSMPQLGESVTEGTIGRWLKQPGEQVDKYEPLVEVTTDKVNAEIPSPYAGVLQEIIVPEGETVDVGALIAVIAVAGAVGADAPVPAPQPVSNQAAGEGAGPAERGEPSAAALPTTAPAALDFGPTGRTPNEAPEAAPVAASPRQDDGASDGATDRESSGARRRYTPLVLRLAEQHDIPLTELSQLRGSGLGGRVGKNDVLRYLETRAAPAAGRAVASAPVSAPEPPPVVERPPAAPVATPSRAPSATENGRASQVLPWTPIRKAIAEHMVRSVATSPHAWTMTEVDMTAVAAHRAATKDEFRRREGVGLSFLPYFVEAVAAALKEYPVLNSSFTDQGIELKREINIGIAVALDDQQGLVVPVIKRADEMNLVGLARALDDLVRRARGGKLTLDDLRGGTFTVNNPGSFGSILSQPIINQPQAAIVTMEAIVKRPVVVTSGGSDMIAIRQLMNVAISFDHRILDGLTAGQFLGAVKRRLEAVAPAT